MDMQREVVVVSGVRTAIGDFGGGLKDVSPTELGTRVVREALSRAGVAGTDGAIDASRIVNVLAKADPSPDGMLRGWRHIMLDDTDISATRHARAAVGGMIASLTGCPAAFVSGGAEHQGPPGGGTVAVIARVSE